MRDIMYHQQPNSPRLTNIDKDANIFAILSPKIIRRQRSTSTDLEKSTSVPNFPPISRTKCESQEGRLRSLDNVTHISGDSDIHVYRPQKPRPPRPGTPTFHSPFFRRTTHNKLEKRVLSEPAMDISLLSTEQRRNQPILRPGSRPGSRTSLSRPKLGASISCSSTHESSNVSTDELSISLEYIPQQSKLGSIDSPRYYTRQNFNFTNRIDQPEEQVLDKNITHDCIIESDELLMDKITELPTKDLVDKCQKWLEGVAQASHETQ